MQKNIKYGQKSAQITLCIAHKPHVNVLPNSGNQGLKNERDDCCRCVASTDNKPRDVEKSDIMLPENHGQH